MSLWASWRPLESRVAQDSQADRRRKDRAERERSGIVAAVVISLLAHLALIPPMLWLIDLKPRSVDKSPVRVVQMSRSAWLNNRQIRQQDKQQGAPKKTLAKPEPDDSPEPPGQVVALPPSDDAAPEKADFASEDNHKVEHETRSRHQSADYLNPANRPQIGDTQRKNAAAASQPGRAKIVLQGPQQGGAQGPGHSSQGNGQSPSDTAPPQASDQAPTLPHQQQRDALTLRQDAQRGQLSNRRYSEEILGQADRLNLRLRSQFPSPPTTRDPIQRPAGPEGAQGGDGSKRPGTAALFPDTRELQRLSGGPLNDYLPEVEEDEATFLNAWQWKHAPFFNRIAESIRREWHPGVPLAQRDPSGQIYGIEDRYTVLRVTIDRQGAIEELVVAESCGVDFLDQEAMRAFRAAQPFANPPRKLFARGDTYSFQFGFNVDFQTAPLVRFNWRATP